MGPEDVVQERMKSNLRNHMQMVSDQVKQSTKKYQWNVEGAISSLGTALTEDIWGMCACITDCLDLVPPDVSDSCKVSSFAICK